MVKRLGAFKMKKQLWNSTSLSLRVIIQTTLSFINQTMKAVLSMIFLKMTSMKLTFDQALTKAINFK